MHMASTGGQKGRVPPISGANWNSGGSCKKCFALPVFHSLFHPCFSDKWPFGQLVNCYQGFDLASESLPKCGKVFGAAYRPPWTDWGEILHDEADPRGSRPRQTWHKSVQWVAQHGENADFRPLSKFKYRLVAGSPLSLTLISAKCDGLRAQVCKMLNAVDFQWNISQEFGCAFSLLAKILVSIIFAAGFDW